MKHVRFILWSQSVYMLLTAIWPIVDIQSFMFISGYKTDIWLVKTVGALLIPVSLTLGSFLFIRSADLRQAILLGSSTCVAFICIDFYYALNDVILDIYLVDGVLQILFLLNWIFILTRLKEIVRQ